MRTIAKCLLMKVLSNPVPSLIFSFFHNGIKNPEA